MRFCSCASQKQKALKYVYRYFANTHHSFGCFCIFLKNFEFWNLKLLVFVGSYSFRILILIIRLQKIIFILITLELKIKRKSFVIFVQYSQVILSLKSRERKTCVCVLCGVRCSNHISHFSHVTFTERRGTNSRTELCFLFSKLIRITKLLVSINICYCITLQVGNRKSKTSDSKNVDKFC